MALTLLNRAQVNSLAELTAASFTKENYDGVNTTIAITAPKGVLGGSVAGIKGNYQVGPCNLTDMPAGLFINDAAGAAYDNSPAVASNKVGVVKAMASVEVDVYETAVTAPYTIGAPLYSSANGLLTTDASTSAVVVGVVTKLATTASPTLGVDMRI